MNNLEDNLRKIKTKEISRDEKESLWHGIMVRHIEEERKRGQLLSVNIFKLSMKKLIVSALALVIILGGGGVVAASNNSVPGDILFPVDLVIEKIQIKLAGENRKTELKLKFAEERVEEIKHVSEEKSTPAVLVADLSASSVTEIEADVFTNETIVKIETNDKKYGYFSAIKIKAELVKEIAQKYSIPEEKVNTLINFEVEDRESRADDKGFLNKTHSINFSERENDDVELALTDLEKLLEGNEDSARAQEIEKSLEELLILLGDDGDLEIKKKDGEIKIKSDNLKIEIKLDKEGKDKINDDSKDSDDDADDDDDSIKTGDIKEDDSEVFCRGEWRDEEDCNDDGDDDSDNSDNSGENKNDDEDSGENSGKNNNEDEDNSGQRE